MKPNNEQFIADLIRNVDDAEMRRKYQQGLYGNIRTQYAKGWRKVHGRK